MSQGGGTHGCSTSSSGGIEPGFRHARLLLAGLGTGQEELGLESAVRPCVGAPRFTPAPRAQHYRHLNAPRMRPPLWLCSDHFLCFPHLQQNGL